MASGWGKSQPIVPPEFLDARRRLTGDSITFCVWHTGPTLDLDVALAGQLANALLLDADIIYVGGERSLYGSEFWEEVHIALESRCEAFLGFRFEANSLPSWLTRGRTYYQAPYVVAVRPDLSEDGPQGVDDLPIGAVLGSPLYTRADFQLLTQLEGRSERLRRIPYTSADAQFDHLIVGDLDAGIFWEPKLRQLVRDTGVTLPSFLFRPAVLIDVAMVFRADDMFLRQLFDEALVRLEEDDVIEQLVQEQIDHPRR